jgi:hypothetical protein
VLDISARFSSLIRVNSKNSGKENRIFSRRLAMCQEEKCRERIREMLKINVSLVDILKLVFMEFNFLYADIKKFLYEEIRKNEKNSQL